ncbi:GtrA family protein [Microbacterium sp. NPDC003461]
MQLIRFALVGGLNTAVDFAILFLLRALGVPLIVANTVSTTVGLCVSFLLNRSYTFRSGGGRGRQFALFLVVTLFGLWVLQPLVIVGVGWVLDELWTLDENLVLLIGKLAATVVSMTWNYILYARVVFRHRDPETDRAETGQR